MITDTETMIDSKVSIVNGDIVINNVMCSNLRAVRATDTSAFFIEPTFAETDGLMGLLIARVSELMGGATCKVGQNSVSRKATPFTVGGNVPVTDRETKQPTTLIKLEPDMRNLIGKVNVRFSGVTTDKTSSLGYDIHVINFLHITVELASGLRAYSK